MNVINAVHGTDYMYAQHRCRCTPCRDAHNEHHKRYPTTKAAHHRKSLRQYGLTAADYEDMWLRQGGACAVCGQPETQKDGYGGTRRLAVDHHHATGRVRGLLCGSCNKSLGLLGEDPKRIRKLAEWLEGEYREADDPSEPVVLAE